SLLGFRPETEALLEPLQRLGIRTLGELVKLPRDALADRFGQAGVSAHRLACGEDDPPRGREVTERLCETQDVGESGSGPARVRTDARGAPVEIDGRAVEQVRESWLVEDRWWTERPLRRRYWEVLSANGRNTVVFHDLSPEAGDDARGERARAPASGGWFC